MSKEYNNKILLEMLDTAIGGLVENEICSYCKIQHNQDHRCKNFEHCQDLIFEGLRQKALDKNRCLTIQVPKNRKKDIQVEYDPEMKDREAEMAERMAETYEEQIWSDF